MTGLNLHAIAALQIAALIGLATWWAIGRQ